LQVAYLTINICNFHELVDELHTYVEKIQLQSCVTNFISAYINQNRAFLFFLNMGGIERSSLRNVVARKLQSIMQVKKAELRLIASLRWNDIGEVSYA
jgi:polyribonucleotide nucleotidyltransferase